MDCIWNDVLLGLDHGIIDYLPEELLDLLQNGTGSQYLDALAVLALDVKWTASIYISHNPLFVDICNRWLLNEGDHFEALDVAAALCRILPLAPHLSVYIAELILKRQAGIFADVISQRAMILSDVPVTKLITLLNIINRLLDFDDRTFTSVVAPAQLQMLMRHTNPCTRYLAIRVFCTFLHVADATFLEMLEKYVSDEDIEGPWEDRTIDYRFLRLWEGKRLKDLNSKLLESPDTQRSGVISYQTSRTIAPTDLLPHTISFGGVLSPSVNDLPRSSSLIILTETTQHNLEATAKAISTASSILITGLSGSGKTSVIREIAQRLGKASTMLTLHLNEQTDAKLLIGIYTSATTPGSFTWQPGVLTTAVREGRWVLIEDLDRAPPDVISAFLPLLDRGELIVPNLGGPIRALQGFKLIATIRSSLNSRGEEMVAGSTMLGVRHWTRVQLQMLSERDLSEIILARFPVLHAPYPTIMRLYQRLSSAHTTGSASSTRSMKPHGRPLGPQDLIRFCTRIDSLFRTVGIQSGFESISEATNDNIFMEAVDCFASGMQTGELRSHIISCIAQELHVAAERAIYCLQVRKPEYVNRGKTLSIGRITLPKRHDRRASQLSRPRKAKRPFAMTDHALRQMESISATISAKEPCLLVGETGTGKTTIVQELAHALGHELIVVNLSQQSEAGDLLGGFKPINMRAIAMPIQEDFEELFDQTFSSQKNPRYVKTLGRTIARGEWNRTLALWRKALGMFEASFLTAEPQEDTESRKKRRKIESPSFQKLRIRWDDCAARIGNFQHHLENGSKGFSFSFVEGNIVRAVRSGDWVLLDEINLASPDTLESLAGLLSDKAEGAASILLSEKGDIERVYAHPDFRIFGAMNPATDIGKRDLPSGLRSRFTEYYIESPDKDLESLKQVINAYLGDYVHSDVQVTQDVAQLYLEIKQLEVENRLVDGADQKPHFSLRTLTRMLTYVTDITPLYGLRRALYEGCLMSFLTVLNRDSATLVQGVIESNLLSGQRNRQALLRQIPRYPSDGKRYIKFRHYWLTQGTCPIEEQPHYIITPFVESNLLNLVRATSTRRFPILLQGPTSSGKTSMVEHLAKLSGNKFVRINNHEHTDLQEYIGTYISDPEGRLAYQEGILVRALREGHWVVLDELNLAPTDVLEALNRLLDDNRELLIPETQQIVRPHENFMLFATQNPPGIYGGRKPLSRAFRNRFLELHFDDIPENELEIILRERTQIAPSFCSKIVSVYRKLAVLRQSGRLFEQKNSFATLRDLFRWALRDADDRAQLAANGFMLLSERVRNPEERLAVKDVIEEVMKERINEDLLYNPVSLKILANETIDFPETVPNIVWTKSMRRLYVLITQALQNNEPVLLVGQTGCGKTSICQAIANIMHTQLNIVNAHQNTETGDLVGAQRPVRNRSFVEAQLVQDFKAISSHIPDSFPNASDGLSACFEAYSGLPADIKGTIPVDLKKRVEQGLIKSRQLFEWSDGSLVQAMKAGQLFLLDEISLADDSVLERLNSVLETSRTLLLAEKGSQESLIKASDGFQFLATMNPGGDYGKRELSPALRNRFTEIWVPSFSTTEDILEIARARLVPSLRTFALPIVKFSAWFGVTYNEMAASASVRQVLAWITFANRFGLQDTYTALLHGAAMVFIDGLGANPAAQLSITQGSVASARRLCLETMGRLFQHDMMALYDEHTELLYTDTTLRVGHFELEKSNRTTDRSHFSFEAPTTLKNTMRIVRALQLHKPVLLEGSPGVGKTALVTALANVVGIPLTRINLSEQTDIMDLFGSDVPVEGATAGQFAWRDAPFLRAMQQGEWVLLDEMNLASQSVLEGLNACLDHRGQVYIPELDQTFSRHPQFVLFAAQNPHRQGGGRKGLPASFVNRFTLVYADLFAPEDLLAICGQLYPGIPTIQVKVMVEYVTNLSTLTQNTPGATFNGGPWEFNLRDILRWLQLLDSQGPLMSARKMNDYQNILFLQRFRSVSDVTAIQRRIPLLPHREPASHSYFQNVTTFSYQCGLGLLPRHGKFQSRVAKVYEGNLGILESVMLCVQQTWPCLLVGTSGSGKSTLVQHLALMVGANLVELSLSADMDTMDLVGGYEQVDHERPVANFFKRLQLTVEAALMDHILSSSNSEMLFSLLNLSTDAGHRDLGKTYQVLRELQDNSIVPLGTTLIDECALLMNKSSVDNRARFEWVDGVLVKALESGDWLVLDNANLCSSSVLDRLNSLLEPHGVLAVNEHRSSDGSSKVVKPHKNFRLFLTMDPRHGELSRAMRNRCIELFMHPRLDHSHMNHGKYPCDSLTFRFCPFERFEWNTLDDASAQALASICVDHLAFKDFYILRSWVTQARNGLLDMEPSRLNLVSKVFMLYVQLAEQKALILSTIWKMYQDLTAKKGLPDGFINAQTVHPLINSSLLSLSTEGVSQIRPTYLASLLEATLALEVLRQHLVAIESLLYNKSSRDMSRLERSIASHRTLGFAKDSTQPLASFLESVMACLTKWIEKQAQQPQSPKTTVKPLKDFVDYLSDFSISAQQPRFDESVFQAYLAIGSTLTTQALLNVDFKDTAMMIGSYFLSFKEFWELSTGGSMEILWYRFRPPTAQNKAEAELASRIDNIADKFDDLKWRSKIPLDTLARLHLSIATLSHAARTLNEETLKPIEEALDDIERRLPTSNTTMTPYFKEEFEGLNQFYGCIYPRNAADRPVILDLLAGWPARRSILLREPTAQYHSLLQITGMTGILSTGRDLLALRNTVPVSILSKLSKLVDVPLKSLDLLEHEIRYLTNFASRACQFLGNSQYNALNSCLWQLHEELLGVHAPHFTAQSLEQYEQCLIDLKSGRSADPRKLKISLKSGASQINQFPKVFDAYIGPSLYALQGVETEVSQTVSTAEAWISFFTGCLLLYVPDRPFDPATKPMVENSRFRKRSAEIETKLSALQLYEQTMTGQTNSFRSELVEQELEALGSQPPVPAVYRPAISELSLLQGEFSNLLDSIVRKSPCAGQLCLVTDGVASAIQELNLVRQNLSQIVHRLSNNYRAYDDIVKPVVGFLSGLDVGLALAIMVGNSKSGIERQVQEVCTLTPFMDLRPNYLEMLPSVYSTAISQGTRGSCLKLGAIEYAISGILSDRMARSISEVFQRYYEEWKQQLGEDQDKYSARSSLYRYRGDQNDSEDAIEEELRTVFPDYEKPVQDAGIHTENKSVDAPTVSQKLADCQRAIFLEGLDVTDQMIHMLQDASDSIVQLWRHSGNTTFFPTNPKLLLSNMTIALSNSERRISAANDDGRQYNFYIDANLTESRKLVSLMLRIQDRFIAIQKTWPEHATLEDVIRTSLSVLSFRNVEPLAKIITKCEQLHSYVYEWQAVASREYSALNLYNELTDLLVNWRRIELSTWARLLDMEDRKSVESAKSWWFLAYEVIVAASLSAIATEDDFTGHIRGLIATLENFLHQTSIGQLSERLQLIELFKDHLDLLGRQEPSMYLVRDALINLIRFYIRFKPIAKEFITKGRRALEKDMKEIILLASWKDTNITALRESAKRSHHKLFKVIRKYRAILAQPAEIIIRQGFPELLVGSKQQKRPIDRLVSVADGRAIQFCQENIPNWQERPSRYTNPDKTALIMDRLGREPALQFDYTLYIESFCTNLIDTIKVLQKETPSVLTTENKSIVKHLKSRKRKLFADTLKEIKDMGFNSNPGADILGKQMSKSDILATSPALESGRFSSTINLTEYYFHKTLDNMAIIREGLGEHSNELSAGEVTRSIGYLESLLSILLKQRANLAPSLHDLNTLQISFDKLQCLWSPGAYELHQSTSPQDLSVFKSTKQCVQWLPYIIDVAITVIKQHDRIGDLDSSVILDALGQSRRIFMRIANDFTLLPVLPRGLVSSLHTQILEEANHTLELLAEDLKSWQIQQPVIAFALDQILLWTTPSIVEGNVETNGVHVTTTAAVDEWVSRISDTILVGVQRLERNLSKVALSSESSSWLLMTDTARANGLRLMHVKSLTDQVETAMSELQHIPENAWSSLKVAAALFTVTTPIFKQYSLIHEDCLQKYLELHMSTCKMASVLSSSFKQIMTQGFCSPSENSAAEPGQSEKLEEGTGLGEGEGAEDISKDIQDDEDLSELAAEGKKEKDQEEIEDEKDAVDMMQDELEGELGESREDDEDNKSGEESSSSNDDIDEETGEVDDLDPAAIDEKLWDGSGDEAEKTQEGDQSNGKTKDEVTAQDQPVDKEENQTGEEDQDDREGAEESEEVHSHDVGQTDPHLQEEQHLDLPDEINLDDEIESAKGSDDAELESMSDATQDEAEETGEEKESFANDDTERPEMKIDQSNGSAEEDDIEKTEEAGSPVDTEPDEDRNTSDEELLRDRTNDGSANHDDAVPSDMQGIGGNAESQENTQELPDTAAQSSKGAKSNAMMDDDAEAEASEGVSGHAAATVEGSASQPDTRQEISESEAFKKLGDALETWHRQSQRIQKASENDQHEPLPPKDTNDINQDYEHLPDQDAEADTQALGAATEDQARALDERALDSEAPDHHGDFWPNEPLAPEIIDEDQVMEDADQRNNNFNQQEQQPRAGAVVGIDTSNQDHSRQDDLEGANREKDVEELEDNLQSIQIMNETHISLRSVEDARQLWSHYESATRELALSLTEQLRLILAPTLATKMRGDFRTGKRLNIKRIIPYIASQYKRDKIWMRRSVPSKRNYQIMLAVDDSKSMGESGSGELAFETLALVSKSLSMLEVGQICIVGFGDEAHVAHDFNATFSSDAGVQIVQQFGFQQTRTNVRELLTKSIELFREARHMSFNAGTDLWQLELIISDGVCEDHESIRRLVRQAQEERIMVVFVIVDSLKGESIMDMTQATFEPDEGGETKLRIKRYLDGFPFGYYLIVGDVKDLPTVLATALRQWFAEVVESA